MFCYIFKIPKFNPSSSMRENRTSTSYNHPDNLKLRETEVSLNFQFPKLKTRKDFFVSRHCFDGSFTYVASQL
jgi:hypothetical protein